MASSCGRERLLLNMTLIDLSRRVVFDAYTKFYKYLFRNINPAPSGGLVKRWPGLEGFVIIISFCYYGPTFDNAFVYLVYTLFGGVTGAYQNHTKEAICKYLEYLLNIQLKC